MAGFLEWAGEWPAGIALRARQPEDEPFTCELFASTRSEEMALVPWPPAQKAAFLRSQFELQDRYYRQQFPAAEHLVVTQAAAAIGRLVVDHEPTALHLMDITLLPGCRGNGLGTALLLRLLAWGDELGVPVRLYVESFNPAFRLYARLGFEPGAVQGVHRSMQRPVGSAAGRPAPARLS